MNKGNTKINIVKTAPIFLAFLCMGFGDAVGPLVGLVKESFSLSNFHAQLISLSGFIMFGLLSIPLGVLQDKKGKKFMMNLGLIIAFVGLIIPIINGIMGLSGKSTAAMIVGMPVKSTFHHLRSNHAIRINPNNNAFIPVMTHFKE